MYPLDAMGSIIKGRKRFFCFEERYCARICYVLSGNEETQTPNRSGQSSNFLIDLLKHINHLIACQYNLLGRTR